MKPDRKAELVEVASSVGKKVNELTKSREAVFRQGKVVSVSSGPPRTITAEIAGTNYTNIRVADSIAPVAGEGVWIVDIGMGRWLAVATSSNTLTGPAFLQTTGTVSVSALNAAGTITASTFSGSGSLLTSLNADNLSLGSVPNARISGSYTNFSAITASGTVTAATFSGSGSSLTGLNASELDTGTVPNARLNTSYTNIVNLTASGTVTANTLSGSLAATNLTGTIASGRISGTYGNITGVGALDSGSITNNFGSINIGTSVFTGGELRSPSSNPIRITGTSGVILMTQFTGTTSTSNHQAMYWSTGLVDNIARFTSSRELKDQIQTLRDVKDPGAIIDSLRPVTFIEKEKPGETPEGTEWRTKDVQHGFIAEEIADIENGQLGTYDTRDGTLIPVSWRHHDILAIAVAEIQSLRERVAQLEGN